MSDKKDEILNEKLVEGHEYDGIKELDNPLPNWWLWTFFFTMIFAFLYFIHYELGGGGLSSDEALELKMARIKHQRATQAKTAVASVKDLSLETILNSPDMLQEGEKNFAQFCASCHGDKGQGMIGPNLTDKFWIHSKGEFESIMTAINKGFPTKGMPGWETLIPNDKKPLIAAYVKSLQGTNPQGAKAPQGEKVE